MSYDNPDLERLLRLQEHHATNSVITSFASAIICIIVATFLFNLALSFSSRLDHIQQKILAALKELVVRSLEATGLPTSALSRTSLPGFGSGFSLNPLDKSRQDGLTSPPGLQNPANGCFQNSVIQGLASLASLPGFLKDISRPGMRESGETIDILTQMLEVLNEGSTSRSSYRLPPKLSNMNVWQQQDAQEYFTKLYDRVEKDVLRNLSASSNGSLKFPDGETDDSLNVSRLVVNNPLEGLQAQRVSCTSCGYSEGISITPFNCLTLQLEGYGSQRLDRLLDAWTKIDYIEDVECARCTLRAKQTLLKGVLENAQLENTKSTLQTLLAAVESALEFEDFSEETLLKRCNIPKSTRIKRTKTKQIIIARPARALVIHFNRSIYTQYGDQVKNNAPITFDAEFDIRPWCLGHRKQNDAKHQSLAEDWTMDPEASMLPDGPLPESDPSSQYQLKAVVQHQGSADDGHYICYRKFKSEEKGEERWFIMNDALVYPTNEDRVLSESGTFMLFYERSDVTTASHTLFEMIKHGVPASPSDSLGTMTTCAPQERRIDSVITSERSSVDLSELPRVAALA